MPRFQLLKLKGTRNFAVYDRILRKMVAIGSREGMKKHLVDN